VTPDEAAGIGVALNESTLLDLLLDPADGRLELVIDVLTLPEEGPAPEDARVLVQLRHVSRVVFRQAGPGGSEPPLTIDQVAGVVRAHAGRPMYGWNFIDTERPEPDAPDFEWRSAAPPAAHRLWVFQGEGLTDLFVWFRTFEVSTLSGRHVPLDEFIAGGKRWWDGLYAGDPRTANRGIVPSG
jgi:hypothetical protein